ncbi:cellobiose phosphorylase [Povalibacter uvarum]|uniref:Cellobiose phosphorylase n=1 Tax=Povalibacter uvarum TaxID=732238 RepID=A0A841HMY3_9GAMM|nr:hypothetical protein [Povalibacter uvarum]MBB6093709.1 cellobiose phosphorylase [Povalibacter uvarum]
MSKESEVLSRLAGAAGLTAEIYSNGALGRLECAGTLLNLFVGNAVEGSPANLYLRRYSDGSGIDFVPLLGPTSPTRGRRVAPGRWEGSGSCHGIDYGIALYLSPTAPAWFWQVSVENRSGATFEIDLVYSQDVGLSSYGMVRTNEYYVSQYIDHSPLDHERKGWVVASRQNLAAGGRNPWCVIGSLCKGTGFATDALQLHGLDTRASRTPGALLHDLPSDRLQHEHSMVSVQDERVKLRPGVVVTRGFFGLFSSDHPDATSDDDLTAVDQAVSLSEAAAAHVTRSDSGEESDDPRTWFTMSPALVSSTLTPTQLRELFPGEWRHRETDASGAILSFFHGDHRHVVLREKELRVTRPHGHLLRTGQLAVPDEAALTSTVWMNGVFHSMLTQGHVSINRLLSTVRSYLGLFRSHGLRVFVDAGDGWQLLGMPSAFEMTPATCRWIYRHAQGLIEVRSEARSNPHELTLSIDVQVGAPVRCLLSQHIALNGDDGNAGSALSWSFDNSAVSIRPAAGSELAQRFPQGSFEIVATKGTTIEKAGTDELLFADGQSRGQSYLCIITAKATSAEFSFRGHLVADKPASTAAPRVQEADAALSISVPAQSEHAEAVTRLVEILPWYAHNALIHYLSPRGLEQYSGGGWGTRDVTQGPVEMLLALGQAAPVRDLLLRVMSAQSPDGDWPQWFMFFERERKIRAGDSHGDIVFWPVLALSQYLLASGDATILEERLPFFADDPKAAEQATLWEHAQRALAVIHRRIITGTALAAYGHGDWNDSLQPADPSMRDDMSSAWTVTLHYQTLATLAKALRLLRRADEADRLEAQAAAIQRDFQRLLLVDGVLTGYAMFERADHVRYLLHPRDEITGVRYSSLAMIHAILEGMFTQEQAIRHLQLIRTHLSGPDGVRLFDRPMNYHGGPQQFFQRAESATFFGREIGLMYMHAHLRYAQALAHVGDADGFFHALCQANPIAIESIVPTATVRQANCYYSSSDAAFADRYQASAEYDSIVNGTVALDGGWRVYSSGAGIALSLIYRRFLGISRESESLSIDPVMPASLDGLRVQRRLEDRDVEVVYQVGSRGHGVSAVSLNGRSLPFTTDANPYRQGAARVAVQAFAQQLMSGRNVMVIALG